MLHEWEHCSEDYDFQCEDPDSQHYKKQGWVWVWILAAGIVFIYPFIDFLYAHYPDDDYFRKPMAPPLYSKEVRDVDKFWSTREEDLDYKIMRDAGLVPEPPFKIVDGKKVMGRFVGVNNPMEKI